ncbi:MAG: alpha-mannosidase [Clostridia bacterium]|nr:alpha-mannosidase [Clostridia bacterium]
MTNNIIRDKIRESLKVLDSKATLSSEVVEMTYVPADGYKKDNTPPCENAGWKPLEKYTVFEGEDSHYWLHAKIKTPTTSENQEVRFTVKTGKEGLWDAVNPQFTVFVDGVTTQALDTNHTWFPLEGNKEYDIYLYLYTGMLHKNSVAMYDVKGIAFNVTPTLNVVDLKIESLWYDIKVPYDCLKNINENSVEYYTIQNHLNKATMLLDLRDFYSPDFYNSIDATSKYLKEEFYEKECGNNKGVVNCIGHTHIDVAWLWTVAQTREKAQRSFSTVINMMKYFDDYMFMSSQPQLYQHVKEQDPALYEEIKKRVKEGRWEVEGAAWLEADTNLISGESMVRQILFGKRFMKEEFDVDSEILWLPDVFGYSGALPQVLKKSGVDKFFTSKLRWNETNKMPHDDFVWEGIDGSQIHAKFNAGYVGNINPDWVWETWSEYKDKELNDETLNTFGYGDGGGGPTYEMMENFKRLEYGLPGMPAVRMQTAGENYKKSIENFNKNTEELKNKPKWKGEMYLEFHRGTYTSIAKNKKNNRKSENIHLNAENISAMDMVLNGGEYPKETLDKNQRTILLNQFHDIIPGSSIGPVYDVTDVEYAQVLKEGREIVENKKGSIISSLKTDGGLFVYNPSPFAVSDYVEVDGKTVYVENVPAHGFKVVEEKYVDTGVTVCDKCIENDVLKVVFNDKYHIVSVYDKVEDREVLAENAEANVIEMFEDYPREYDAWEITEYYKQKKWIADDVTSVEPLKNGFRIKRKYLKSEIIQDITLRKGSKRVDFVTTVDWHEDHTLMKAAFPVDIHNTVATYDIQFGNVERPTYANTSWDGAKFEVCAHKWADLSESDYGVSIINDCKYGYNIEENVMKISLLKAATYPYENADRGMHSFTYSLFPHCGDFRKGGVIKEGYALNIPLEVSKAPANNGTICDNYSIVSSDKENVIVEAIKKAEDDNSIIVRLYDAYNKKTNVTITAGFDFKEAYICDLMENNIEKLENKGRDVEIKVKNFEIVTLKYVR